MGLVLIDHHFPHVEIAQNYSSDIINIGKLTFYAFFKYEIKFTQDMKILDIISLTKNIIKTLLVW